MVRWLKYFLECWCTNSLKGSVLTHENTTRQLKEEASKWNFQKLEESFFGGGRISQQFLNVKFHSTLIFLGLVCINRHHFLQYYFFGFSDQYIFLTDETLPKCSMYGLFTYIRWKMATFKGKCKITIPFMEHLACCLIESFVFFFVDKNNEFFCVDWGWPPLGVGAKFGDVPTLSKWFLTFRGGERSPGKSWTKSSRFSMAREFFLFQKRTVSPCCLLGLGDLLGMNNYPVMWGFCK